MTSYYDVLGVGVDADFEEVRKAYYRKAQHLHPDRYAGSSAAEQRWAEAEMKVVNAAWNTLRNTEARRRHDIELGLVGGDEDGATPADEDLWEPEPRSQPSAFRGRGVPVAIAVVLIAGLVASGVAMVFQADNPSPRWSANGIAELRAAAINGGMTEPQADCFVKAITSRYGPTDDVDWPLVQHVADTCR